MLERIKRITTRFSDRKTRRLFFLILGAKLAGVVIVLAGIKGIDWYFFTKAYAEDAPKIPDHVNALNTMWTLIAAFLVFFMQAGFMCLEAGFARTRETVNVLLEGIVDTMMCGVLFWAFGFAFMFGSGNKIIGLEYFFLHNTPETYGATGVPMLAYWLFQFAFADTCSTITSGAMVGRTAFKGDILYSIGVSGFIYPIIGHWAWGPDGWLATLSPLAFHDFAGSTVVHTIGGFVALAGAIALGPRLGRKFKRDGGGMPPGHDMTIAAVGGVILWFGWYGFNPGSTLSAMDMAGCARVAANTTLAACSGGLMAMAYVYPRFKVWDCGMTVNGFLAGLVAITAQCYWVSPGGALIIGLVAGVVVVLTTDLLEHLRIDDPIGAVPVHGFCGIWGTLSIGLFATGQFGAATPTGPDNSAGAVVTGLFYGGGIGQLEIQALGSITVTAAVLAVSLALMYSIKAVGLLRVSAEGELEGLDKHEHGGPAYPELYGMAHSGEPVDRSRHGAGEVAAVSATGG